MSQPVDPSVPPPQAAPPPPPPAPPAQPAAAAVLPSGLKEDEKVLGLLAHLFYVLCCIGPIINLIFWQVWKDPSSGKSRTLIFQFKQAFFYQLAFAAVSVALWLIQMLIGALGIPVVGFLFWLLSVGVGLLGLVFAIIAAVKIGQGENYLYPVLGDKIKQSES